MLSILFLDSSNDIYDLFMMELSPELDFELRSGLDLPERVSIIPAGHLISQSLFQNDQPFMHTFLNGHPKPSSFSSKTSNLLAITLTDPHDIQLLK